LAAINKDGSYKDVSNATHITGTSGGTGEAAGHDSQEKAAVQKASMVGDHVGNVTSRSDKVCVGTTKTAANRVPLAQSNITTIRKDDALSSVHSTIVVARRGTGAAITSLYKEGNKTGKLGGMPTITSSLGHKPDTVGAAVNTTIKVCIPSMGVTDAIVTGNDAGLAGVIDQPDNNAKSGWVPSNGGCRPATVHNETSPASKGKLNTAKNPHVPNVPSTKDSKSCRSTDARLIKTPVNGGTAGMEQLNGLPIEDEKNLIDMDISTASIFLATEVAEQNTRSSRPVYLLTKGSARIYLTQKPKSLLESLKIEKAKDFGQQGHPRQGRSGMAKDMYPRNKGNPTKKVQAGNMVVNEPWNTVSGFSLKPELKISSAAVEEEKHNPKVTGKK
jgi:hypothetical protein